MLYPDYLLFIDQSPIDEELRKYFADCHLGIVEEKNIFPIPEEQGIPLAILIHWSFLMNQPQIIAQLSATYATPLIVLNDVVNEEFCIYALESGADDFIVKPIYPRELHARINAISRRVIGTQQRLIQETEVLLFEQWQLFPASRQLFKENNQEVHLSAGEYNILHAFTQHSQQVLDREFLSHISRNNHFDPFDRRIDVQISRLRQKIEVDAKKPDLIKTVRNRGYLFTPDVKYHRIKLLNTAL